MTIGKNIRNEFNYDVNQYNNSTDSREEFIYYTVVQQGLFDKHVLKLEEVGTLIDGISKTLNTETDIISGTLAGSLVLKDEQSGDDIDRYYDAYNSLSIKVFDSDEMHFGYKIDEYDIHNVTTEFDVNIGAVSSLTMHKINKLSDKLIKYDESDSDITDLKSAETAYEGYWLSVIGRRRKGVSNINIIAEQFKQFRSTLIKLSLSDVEEAKVYLNSELADEHKMSDAALKIEIGLLIDLKNNLDDSEIDIMKKSCYVTAVHKTNGDNIEEYSLDSNGNMSYEDTDLNQNKNLVGMGYINQYDYNIYKKLKDIKQSEAFGNILSMAFTSKALVGEFMGSELITGLTNFKLSLSGMASGAGEVGAQQIINQLRLGENKGDLELISSELSKKVMLIDDSGLETQDIGNIKTLEFALNAILGVVVGSSIGAIAGVALGFFVDSVIDIFESVHINQNATASLEHFTTEFSSSKTPEEIMRLIAPDLNKEIIGDLNYGFTSIVADSKVRNIINGSIGNDTILIKSGNDNIIDSKAGDDYIVDMDGNSTLKGGKGEDKITSGGGTDTMDGGDANDTFVYKRGDGKDTIIDYSLDYIDLEDNLYESENEIIIEGYTSDDIKLELINNDTINPDLKISFHDSPNDQIIIKDYLGKASIKTIVVEDETFTSVGRNIALRNYANGRKLFEGSGKVDLIIGDGISNIIKGNAGNDTIYGYDGNDTLEGGDGADILYGGEGHDTLKGGSGNDQLHIDGIGRGIELHGSVDNELAKGGSGSDKYIIDKVLDSDVIIDDTQYNTTYIFDDTTNGTVIDDTDSIDMKLYSKKDLIFAKGSNDSLLIYSLNSSKEYLVKTEIRGAFYSESDDGSTARRAKSVKTVSLKDGTVYLESIKKYRVEDASKAENFTVLKEDNHLVINAALTVDKIFESLKSNSNNQGLDDIIDPYLKMMKNSANPTMNTQENNPEGIAATSTVNMNSAQINRNDTILMRDYSLSDISTRQLGDDLVLSVGVDSAAHDIVTIEDYYTVGTSVQYIGLIGDEDFEGGRYDLDDIVTNNTSAKPIYGLDKEYYFLNNDGSYENKDYQKVKVLVDGSQDGYYYEAYLKNDRVMVSLKEFVRSRDDHATLEWNQEESRAYYSLSNGETFWIDYDDVKVLNKSNDSYVDGIALKMLSTPDMIKTDENPDYTMMVDLDTMSKVFDFSYNFDGINNTVHCNTITDTDGSPIQGDLNLSTDPGVGSVNDVQIVIGNTHLEMDKNAYLDTNKKRTMVDVKSFIHAFNVISKDDISYEMNSMNEISITYRGKISHALEGSMDYTVNDSNTIDSSIDNEPIVNNSELFVPLHFMKSVLGEQLAWNQSSYTASFINGEIEIDNDAVLNMTPPIIIDDEKVVTGNGGIEEGGVAPSIILNGQLLIDDGNDNTFTNSNDRSFVKLKEIHEALGNPENKFIQHPDEDGYLVTYQIDGNKELSLKLSLDYRTISEVKYKVNGENKTVGSDILEHFNVELLTSTDEFELMKENMESIAYDENGEILSQTYTVEPSEFKNSIYEEIDGFSGELVKYESNYTTDTIYPKEYMWKEIGEEPIATKYTNQEKIYYDSNGIEERRTRDEIPTTKYYIDDEDSNNIKEGTLYKYNEVKENSIVRNQTIFKDVSTDSETYVRQDFFDKDGKFIITNNIQKPDNTIAYSKDGFSGTLERDDTKDAGIRKPSSYGGEGGYYTQYLVSYKYEGEVSKEAKKFEMINYWIHYRGDVSVTNYGLYETGSKMVYKYWKHYYKGTLQKEEQKTYISSQKIADFYGLAVRWHENSNQVEFLDRYISTNRESMLINMNALNRTEIGGNSSDKIIGTDILDGEDQIAGLGGNDRLEGRNGKDIIVGGAGSDEIFGGSGEDKLYGGEDSDKIYGGSEIDQIFGGSANDIIYGDSHGDFIFGGTGADTISGGSGNDLIRGDFLVTSLDDGAQYDDSSIDTIFGDSGNDTIYGDNGADVLDGGSDNDMIYGGSGNDLLKGGSGIDVLHGGRHNDTLEGNSGYDSLYGGEGNDKLNGGTGNDALIGGSGSDDYIFEGNFGRDTIQDHDSTSNIDLSSFHSNDISILRTMGSENLVIRVNNTINQITVNDYFKNPNVNKIILSDKEILTSDIYGAVARVGSTESDYIKLKSSERTFDGGLGNDTIIGTEEDDIISGSFGSDQLVGGIGSDKLYGGNSSDSLYGGANNDTLHGDEGADSLYGDHGDDILIGGSGDDILNGGIGSDTYRFDFNSGKDTINEYASEFDVNIVEFSEAIGDSTFSVINNDLIVNNGSAKVTVEDFYAQSNLIQEFIFNDETLNNDQVRMLGLTGVGRNHGETYMSQSTNDVINGYGGHDTYIFSGAFGTDVISQENAYLSDQDKIVLQDLNLADTVFRLEGNHVYIYSKSDKVNNIKIEDVLSSKNKIVEIQFADTVLSLSDFINYCNLAIDNNASDIMFGSVINDYVHGTDKNDILIGTAARGYFFGNNGDDTFIAGEGDEYMEGNSGNDTFVFSGDFGLDSIGPDGALESDKDVLKIEDLNLADTKFRISGDSVYISSIANILNHIHMIDVLTSTTPISKIEFKDITMNITELRNYCEIAQSYGVTNIMFGSENKSITYGGNERVLFIGNVDESVMLGGNHNDIFILDKQNSKTYGRSGNDIFVAKGTNLLIDSGLGNDTINLKGGSSRVITGDGKDVINVSMHGGQHVVEQNNTDLETPYDKIRFDGVKLSDATFTRSKEKLPYPIYSYVEADVNVGMTTFKYEGTSLDNAIKSNLQYCYIGGFLDDASITSSEISVELEDVACSSYIDSGIIRGEMYITPDWSSFKIDSTMNYIEFAIYAKNFSVDDKYSKVRLEARYDNKIITEDHMTNVSNVDDILDVYIDIQRIVKDFGGFDHTKLQFYVSAETAEISSMMICNAFCNVSYTETGLSEDLNVRLSDGTNLLIENYFNYQLNEISEIEFADYSYGVDEVEAITKTVNEVSSDYSNDTDSCSNIVLTGVNQRILLTDHIDYVDINGSSGSDINVYGGDNTIVISGKDINVQSGNGNDTYYIEKNSSFKMQDSGGSDKLYIADDNYNFMFTDFTGDSLVIESINGDLLELERSNFNEIYFNNRVITNNGLALLIDAINQTSIDEGISYNQLIGNQEKYKSILQDFFVSEGV